MLNEHAKNRQKSSIWKRIDSINFDDCNQLLIKLKLDGHIISPWIENIVSINLYRFNEYEFPIYLVRKKLEDFGFDGPTELKMVYSQIQKNGFELVNPEIAIFTRILYDDQPKGEWLRFATPMRAMIDSDGVQHLPKLGQALGRTFIETYWAYPQAIFHPHNEFVMVKNNCC